MSCIVYQTDRKTGVKYAYESVSYWDKEKQQPRSKRKYIGKVDPETGEIIAKKDRAVHSGEDTTDQGMIQIEKLQEELSHKDEEIASLKAEISVISKKYDNLLKSVSKIQKILDQEL